MKCVGWNSLSRKNIKGDFVKIPESIQSKINEVKYIFKKANDKNNDLIPINNKLVERKKLLNLIATPPLNQPETYPSQFVAGISKNVILQDKKVEELSYNILRSQGYNTNSIEAISKLLSIAKDPKIIPIVNRLLPDDSRDVTIDKLKSLIRKTYVDRLSLGYDTLPSDIAVYIKFLNSFHKNVAFTSLHIEPNAFSIDKDITKNVILLASFAEMYNRYPSWNLCLLKDSTVPFTCLKYIIPFKKFSEIPLEWIGTTQAENEIRGDVSKLLDSIRQKNIENRIENEKILPSADAAPSSRSGKIDPSTKQDEYILENFTMPTFKQHLDTKNITVKSLSSHLNCDINKVMDIARELVDATSYNSKLSVEESDFIAQELGYYDKMLSTKRTIKTRPPIIAIMGHIDHGKTTLLDFFRKSTEKIAATEAGGITQKLGAFQVKLSTTEKVVTFIDTPGHSAFTSMRKRGSAQADIIIFVVAADDGLQQFHPRGNSSRTLLFGLSTGSSDRGGGYPEEQLAPNPNNPPPIEEGGGNLGSHFPVLIVAINKIDRGVDLKRVYAQLEAAGIGQDTKIVEISAKYGTNVDKLEEAITDVAESLELKANYHEESRGTAFVLETGVGIYGKHVTAIVLDGVLKRNYWIVVGSTSSKVKRILNESNESISVAYPGQVVSLAGLSNITAIAGQVLTTSESQKEANRVATLRSRSVMHLQQDAQASIDTAAPCINLLVKSVDQGSLEAILEWIKEFNGRRYSAKWLKDRGFVDVDMESWNPFRVVSSAVGPLTTADIQLASINKCYLITFSLDNSSNVVIPEDFVVVKQNIIYNLFEDLENIFNDNFGPLYTYTTVARMKVTKLATINIKKETKLAIGTSTSGGIANLSHFYRVLRNGVDVYEDLEVLSMRVDKLKVDEIPKNNSSNAIVFKQDVDIQVGDEILAQTRVTNEKAL